VLLLPMKPPRPLLKPALAHRCGTTPLTYTAQTSRSRLGVALQSLVCPAEARVPTLEVAGGLASLAPSRQDHLSGGHVKALLLQGGVLDER
jgi:hypothetical protein